MDKRTLQLRLLGLIPVIFLFTLIGGSLFAIGSYSTNFDWSSVYIPPFFSKIVYFSLKQAFLSTLLSIALAIPVVWAFYKKRSSWTYKIFARLFTFPIILSSLVVSNAIVLFYGRNGWFSYFLQQVGITNDFSIYGLSGILIGHLFFNLPLAVRLFLISLESLPDSYEKTAIQLNLKGFNHFKTLLLPYILRQIPSVSFFIFLLCFTSFTMVLILGGGPQSTTIEVEIFRNMNLGLDGFPFAIILSLLQMVITLIILAVMYLLYKPIEETTNNINQPITKIYIGKIENYFSLLILLLCSLFIIFPLINLIVSSLNKEFINLLLRSVVQDAILTSIKIAFFSSIFTCLLSLLGVMGKIPSIPLPKGNFLSPIFDNISYLIFIFSPIILSTGWFLLLYKYVNPISIAIYMIIILNIAISLPICGHILSPTWYSHINRHDKLIKSLDIGQFKRFFLFDLPYLKIALSRCFAFAFIFSLGDLSVIAIWGNDELNSLPTLIQQNMGNYRNNTSAMLSVILMLISFTVLLIFDKIYRKIN
ncbi:hypothetical protein [Bartonella sp. DGB1]|uniref:hypothetical protein n=1 Tax=Bartonella sp. DGB1 TaxID=3239807 RepID=UPI003524518A